MADIYPFKGIRYNQAVMADLAQAICPPYDIISPQLQSELYWRSEHNFIRLEHARELPHDTASENKYTRSAATLTQWLAQGILTVEEAPAVYLHDHYFQYQGKEYRRRGIIALVRLEEWDRRVIRPHEGTLANAKSDRLTLLRTLQANTSSILALFEDPKISYYETIESECQRPNFYASILHFICSGDGDAEEAIEKGLKSRPDERDKFLKMLNDIDDKFNNTIRVDIDAMVSLLKKKKMSIYEITDDVKETGDE